MKEAKTSSQIGRMSRNKGKAFERTVSKMLTSRGFPARRAVQFDGMFDHDIKVEIPFNFECKAVENLNIYKAMVQSRADALRANTIPTVVHKRNNTTPLITMDFTHFLDLLQWAMGYVDEGNTLDIKEYREKWIEKHRKESEAEDLL